MPPARPPCAVRSRRPEVFGLRAVGAAGDAAHPEVGREQRFGHGVALLASEGAVARRKGGTWGGLRVGLVLLY